MRSSVRRMKAEGARLGRRESKHVPGAHWDTTLGHDRQKQKTRRGQRVARFSSHKARVNKHKLGHSYVYNSSTNFANLLSHAAMACFFCSSGSTEY